MNRPTRRILSSMMAVVFLIAACAPAPAAAPAATQDPALAQQVIEQSVALTVAAQDIQAKDQQLTEQSGAMTVAALVTLTPAGEDVDELPDLPTDTPTPLETFTPVPTQGYDVYCEPIIDVATQKPQLESQLEAGKTVIIKNRVNLRTQPSRLNRIILVLKPGTQVKIIDGPVETQYIIGKYVWWKVELPGGLTGWSAELSVCGRYYFLDPSTATATASQ